MPFDKTNLLWRRFVTKEERVARIAKYYTTLHLFGDWYLVRNWSKNCRSWMRLIPYYILMRINEEGVK